MKLLYDFINKDIVNQNVEDTITTVKSETPEWWKKTCPFLGGYKSATDFFKKGFSWNLHAPVESISTVKLCPGVGQHFSNSILVKFPCDTFIELGDNDLEFRWKCSNREMHLSQHPAVQAPHYIGENFHIVKFCTNLSFKTSSKSKGCFIDPIYYNDQPYRCAPGMFDSSSENFINVIVMFPKKAAKYYFKAGEPLAVMQFYDKITGIKRADHTSYHKKQQSGQKKFYLSWK